MAPRSRRSRPRAYCITCFSRWRRWSGCFLHPRQRLLVIAEIEVLFRHRRHAAFELRAQLEHILDPLHIERAIRIEALQRRVVGLRGNILRQAYDATLKGFNPDGALDME